MKDISVDPAELLSLNLRRLWSPCEEIDDEIINVTMGLLSAEDVSRDSQRKWLYTSSHFWASYAKGEDT